MPYERCIETWAREGDIAWIPGPGRRHAGQNQAKPGAGLDRGTFIISKRSEIHQKLILFGLDVYEKPIQEGP